MKINIKEFNIDTSTMLPGVNELIFSDIFRSSLKEIFTDKHLIEKIEKLKALESVAGILNNLSFEEIKVFEDAVKRRPLLK